MTDTFNQVKEFHETFGHPVVGKPFPSEVKTVKLRLKLILEEFIELTEASLNMNATNAKAAVSVLESADKILDHLEVSDIDQDMVEIADALGDIKYVTDGAALCWGIPLNRVSTEIHNSNMSKLGDDGKPIYREDGKILKGPGYFKPNIDKIIYSKGL